MGILKESFQIPYLIHSNGQTLSMPKITKNLKYFFACDFCFILKCLCLHQLTNTSYIVFLAEKLSCSHKTKKITFWKWGGFWGQNRSKISSRFRYLFAISFEFGPKSKTPPSAFHKNWIPHFIVCISWLDKQVPTDKMLMNLLVEDQISPPARTSLVLCIQLPLMRFSVLFHNSTTNPVVFPVCKHLGL